MARPRIVIVGAGFAGYHAARMLSRLSRGRADIALVNPMDYFLYLPLLPEVAAGVIDPRRVAVSLPETLPDVRLILGEADRIDLDARRGVAPPASGCSAGLRSDAQRGAMDRPGRTGTVGGAVSRDHLGQRDSTRAASRFPFRSRTRPESRHLRRSGRCPFRRSPPGPSAPGPARSGIGQ
jgi:Pyridine nucleotide-disulphide oxidoreductase